MHSNVFLTLYTFYIQFPQSNKPYNELQSNLSNAAANLNIAATDVVAASKGSPAHLATSSKKFGVAFDNLLHSGVEIIGGTRVFDIFFLYVQNLFFIILLDTILYIIIICYYYYYKS